MIEEKDNPKNSEHSVTVYFNYKYEDLKPIYELADDLQIIINDYNVGEYESHEVYLDTGDAALFMYGPNAEVLYKAIMPTLLKTEFLKGAIAVLQFGSAEDNAPEIEVSI